MRIAAAFCAIAPAMAGCGGNNTESTVQAPGADTSATTDALEAGAALLQDKPPLGALDAYLDGFHFYNGDLEGQMEAHHYCGHLNEDITQCVIYDGNTGNAKLMGVEYILSGRLFERLPAAEKHLWHSHAYEVKSGQLIAPGIPQAAEKSLMRKIAGTYGKTWHTWHTDQGEELPLGSPALMMGFTRDGQADETMVDARDRRFGISTEANRELRKDLPSPAIDPEADAWQKGIVMQVRTERAQSGSAR
jgi:hypothetical protein